MFAEIITIGDEILIGQIVDTNSAFIAKQLNNIGVSVYQITSVQDDKKHILQALKEAEERVDIVIITGGLGPTKDDITKHTLCEYFEDKLVENLEVLTHVETLFKKHLNTPVSNLSKSQAMVLSKAEVLTNQFGTAPGMWIERRNKTIVSLPGVPLEMEGLITGEVIPRIQAKYKRPYILHKTMIIYGIGESSLAERIEDWENALPGYIRLAYLPNLGKVRLRLTAKGEDINMLEKEVEKQIQLLKPLVKDVYYGLEDDDALEISTGKLLTERGQTVSTAESCTGGKIAETFTSVPGSSAYFAGSVVSYAASAKIEVLQIDSSIIDTYSVVSVEVAKAMALSAQKLFNTSYAIATTGNAGPEKGASDAAIGTVFIALATPFEVVVKEFNFGNHREKVINKAVNKAFELLWKEILKK